MISLSSAEFAHSRVSVRFYSLDILFVLCLCFFFFFFLSICILLILTNFQAFLRKISKSLLALESIVAIHTWNKNDKIPELGWLLHPFF